VTVALVQGHTAALQTPPAPASTPAIPFLPSNGSAHDPTAYGSGKSLGSHHAGSGGAAQVGGGPAPAPAPIPADSPDVGGPSIIHENPSSEPSSSVGNGSGFSQQSFQYFPIYVMDENNGIILFNGQYQQAALSGTIDLYAQVKGTTVSTYSWTYNDLQVYSDSGASTYHFHVVLDGTQSYPVGSISLTVTNSSSTVTVLGWVLGVGRFQLLSAWWEFPGHLMPVIDARLLVTPQYPRDFRGNRLECRGWNSKQPREYLSHL
jgi:hypothetical protein